MSKFIYFDIGGVLLEYKDALKDLAYENGVTIADFDTVYERYGQPAERGEMTLEELWQTYKRELYLKSPENFNFLDYWTDRLLPISENHELLINLAQSHRIGIISNIYKNVLPTLIQKQKIPNVAYATIIQSCEVRHIKPEEQIYQIAAQTAGVLPQDIIYIDDRKDFVDFAKTLGWNGIWYEKGSGMSLRNELADYLH